MFDENKKLLKFDDEEFNFEIDYQKQARTDEFTISSVKVKEGSRDKILDVEYENKKEDQSKGFDLDDSGHIPMLEELMASSKSKKFEELSSYKEDAGDFEDQDDNYVEDEYDFVPIGLKKTKSNLYENSLENMRTVLLDKYEEDFSDEEKLSNEEDFSKKEDSKDGKNLLDDLMINFYDEDDKVIEDSKDTESLKLDKLERIANALERIADIMEKDRI